MNSPNNDIVKEQYQNATHLSTRISIHSKYSVNKMGFGNWIVIFPLSCVLITKMH